MKLITDDEEFNEDVKGSFDNLPDSVQKELSRKYLSKLDIEIGVLNECESPIEQILAIQLNSVVRRIEMISEACLFEPQERISVNDKTYRVDFLMCALRGSRNIQYVIECDGHDFHEKTKEQAKKDKCRDRDLTSAGYKVLRFTGSEIYNSPNGCANEISEIVIKDLLSGD